MRLLPTNHLLLPPKSRGVRFRCVGISQQPFGRQVVSLNPTYKIDVWPHLREPRTNDLSDFLLLVLRPTPALAQEAPAWLLGIHPRRKHRA